MVRYKLPRYENETLATVLKYTEVPYHLTAYDNGISNPGLSKTWNKCIERSDADYICLLNSDVNVEPEWLKKMLSVFDTHKEQKPGIVGPITNRCGTHQSGHEKANDLRLVQPCDTLSGFCMVFPKRIWEEVGGFDEGYFLYGEDSDFCERVKEAGYGLFTAYDTFVFHYGHKSMENAEEIEPDFDVQAVRQESAKRFRERWGRTLKL